MPTPTLYINENLTSRRRELFGKAWKIKKDENYHRLWTVDGKILLRKAAGASNQNNEGRRPFKPEEKAIEDDAYRAYKDECAKTGNATPKKKPAFFDEVEELLSEKPCTRPKIVINSSQIVANSLETVESEDDHDENSEPNISSTITINASCSTSNEPNKDDVTETTDVKVKAATSKNAKKRRMSTTDAFSKIDKALESFVSLSASS
ncbi:hypothetical protein OS493_037643 [Desmophyllum pertusum]|uniref:Uncharacterized protein n=1 Tax=Desmophyllum pertusum TaxID=174260 RepID=A0A9X0CH18_9CNID|nr:hypothetical protein OS493_037643 [Desmophyllum pertusum]